METEDERNAIWFLEIVEKIFMFMFGLVKISEEITRTEDISVLTEVKNRNKDGEVIGTTEQYIPGTRTFYRETYKCKGCGEISYGTYSKDRKKL